MASWPPELKSHFEACYNLGGVSSFNKKKDVFASFA